MSGLRACLYYAAAALYLAAAALAAALLGAGWLWLTAAHP